MSSHLKPPEVQTIREHDAAGISSAEIAEMLCAFRFPTNVRNVILNQCEPDGTSRWSLRELFNRFVSDQLSSKPGVVITPFLGFRHAGVKGFWGAIDCITQTDMGESANALWRTKLERLTDGKRIGSGARHCYETDERSVETGFPNLYGLRMCSRRGILPGNPQRSGIGT